MVVMVIKMNIKCNKEGNIGTNSEAYNYILFWVSYVNLLLFFYLIHFYQGQFPL